MSIIFLQAALGLEPIIDFLKLLFSAVLILLALIIVLKTIGKLIEKRNQQSEKK